MLFEDSKPLTDALDTLGALLEHRGESYSMVAVGGGSLMLLDLIQRPTNDLDIVAIAGPAGYVSPRPLPKPFVEAIRDTARSHDLAEDWINTGPADLLDFGLPEGFETRLGTRRFGGLELRLLGRPDQIALKLYAAVDQGPQSKHAADLRELDPSRSELVAGARWARAHDPSPEFRQIMLQALSAFGVEVTDEEV